MKKFDPHSLPYISAIVQTFQYALAGSILIGLRGWFFGGALGLLVSFSMAYASSQISDISKKRTLSAWVAFTALAILSPVYVGTATFYDLGIVTNPVWRGIVAAVWGIIPDGSVALAGFVSGKGMVKREEKSTGQPVITETKPSKKRKKVSRNPITDEQLNDYWLSNPDATNVEVAQHFNVSPQAISKRKSKLYKVVS